MSEAEVKRLKQINKEFRKICAEFCAEAEKFNLLMIENKDNESYASVVIECHETLEKLKTKLVKLQDEYARIHGAEAPKIPIALPTGVMKED